MFVEKCLCFSVSDIGTTAAPVASVTAVLSGHGLIRTGPDVESWRNVVELPFSCVERDREFNKWFLPAVSANPGYAGRALSSNLDSCSHPAWSIVMVVTRRNAVAFLFGLHVSAIIAPLVKR